MLKNRLSIAVFGAIIAGAVFTLSGCFPTGEKDPTQTNSVDLTEDGTYVFSKEYLDVSFEMPEIQNDLPAKIKLRKKYFNTDEILKLFFDGKTILEDKTWSGNYHADDQSHLYVASDDNTISFNDGKTAPEPRDQIDFPVNYMMPVHHLREYFKEEYFPSGELEEFPSSYAIKRAQELLSTLGMTSLGEPDIFAVSLESFEKFRIYYPTEAFFNNSYPLTKDNEIYYLTYQKFVNGIGLADISQFSVKDNTDGRTATVYSPIVKVGVSKDNIFLFDSGAAYEDEYEILSDEPIKYDLNYAVNELQSYLEKSYFSSRKAAKINTAKLVYLPVEVNEEGTVEFVLAWSFEGRIGDVNDIFYWNDYKIIIRADNGTRIVCE